MLFFFFLSYFTCSSIPTKHKVLMKDSEEMQRDSKDLAVIDFPGFKVKRDPVTCLAPFHTPQGTEGWPVVSAKGALCSLSWGLFKQAAGTCEQSPELLQKPLFRVIHQH